MSFVKCMQGFDINCVSDPLDGSVNFCERFVTKAPRTRADKMKISVELVKILLTK